MQAHSGQSVSPRFGNCQTAHFGELPGKNDEALEASVYIFLFLAFHSLYIHVVAKRQYTDPDLGFDHFTGLRIDVTESVTGKIGHHFLTRTMLEDRRDFFIAQVVIQMTAKPGIAISAWVLLAILFPEKLTGYVFFPELIAMRGNPTQQILDSCSLSRLKACQGL